MEQKQFDYGVEIMQPWIISSSTKGQLLKHLKLRSPYFVLENVM